MLSITDPVQPAIAHARRILFAPFNLRKWLVLGFSAFLSRLGGGGSFQVNGNPFSQFSGRQAPDLSPVTAWITGHLPLVIALGAVFIICFLALLVLFQWLGSRGQFMFLDGVARDQAGIVEPWTRLQRPADQLFRFRLLLLLAGLALFGICGGLGVLIALPDLHAHVFGASAFTALVVGGGLLLLGVLALSAVSLLLRDFVVPVMYLRAVGTSEAWAILRQELLPGNGRWFVGFYLLSFLFGLAAAILILVACCLTCCVAVLPYISSVVFLPISVFFRCYSLEFLAQFGEAWKIIQVAEPQA